MSIFSNASNGIRDWAQGAFTIDPNMTPEQLARKRQMIQAMMPDGKARYVGEGLADLARGIAFGVKGRRMDRFEADKRAEASEQFNSILGGPLTMNGISPEWGQDAAVQAAPQGVSDSDPTGPSNAVYRIGNEPAPGLASGVATPTDGGEVRPAASLRDGIIATAQAIGADPLDLATAISYETAGTFDPTKAGPSTQWGQHRGLIQFGEPQARQYGVDFSSPDAAMASQLGPNGAIANYFRSAGFKPGMSGLDLYSTINAGAPGRYSASDAQNGGAPGSVSDKWQNQMGDHRAKAAALLGGDYSPPRMSASNSPAMGYGGPSVQELQAAIMNPWLSASEKQVAGQMLAQAMQASDPMRQLQMQQAQLGLQKTQMEIDAMGQPAGVDYGFQQLDDGTFIRTGSDGSMQEMGDYGKAPEPDKPADEYQRYVAEEIAAGREPLSRIDFAQAKKGSGTVVYDPVTGRPLVSIGGHQDPADSSNPSSPAAMIASIDGILNDPALDMATGWLSWTQNIPGTASRRFGARASQLEGQAFLQAFAGLKGGGQITEIEGRKATQAIGRLDTAQSPEDYRAALTELREVLELGMSRPKGWAASQSDASGEDGAGNVIPQAFLSGIEDPDEAQRVWDALSPEERALFQ